MKPVIVVNFKTYKQGEDVLKLAKLVEKVSKDIIAGVSAADINEISKKTKLKVYCQHVDALSPGRDTGFIIPEAVKAVGAIGSFLNHSEHKLDFETIKKSVLRCKESGLKSMVFAGSLHEALEIEKLNPDYLIYEPPELVAGDISVSSAKPEVISEIAKKLKMPFLVGAGIKTNADVKKSLELGAIGIAVSSAVTTAARPEEVLRGLLG